MKRIPLRRRDGSVRAYALIDDIDAALAAHRWCLDGAYVSRKTRSGRKVYLHRAIVGLRSGDAREADHRNLDKLDNRRANLRVVTHAQNGENVPAQLGTSAHRGVCWHARKRRWMAYAQRGGRRVHLGYHATEQDAADAASSFRAAHLPYSEADHAAA